MQEQRSFKFLFSEHSKNLIAFTRAAFSKLNKHKEKRFLIIGKIIITNKNTYFRQRDFVCHDFPKDSTHKFSLKKLVRVQKASLFFFVVTTLAVINNFIFLILLWYAAS